MIKYKYFVLSLLMTLITAPIFGQAKKPTLMIVPSDAWCNAHGFMQSYNNQGTTEMVPDYKAAFLNDMQLNSVISKINNLMSDRGFPLKDMQQILKSQNADAAREVLTSSKDGMSIAESPVDRLLRAAKADIILELEWSVNKVGPKSSITYNLRGLDAYSNKQIAGSEGTGKGSFSAELPVLLEEAVQDHMDEFCQRLQVHFDDMFANGREVSLIMKTFDGADVDFEKDCDGSELRDVIENWLSDNCVNHRFDAGESSETFLSYEQVRIPLYNSAGRAMNTRDFARQLAKFIQAAPYNIPVKVVDRGLGKCELIFGGK